MKTPLISMIALCGALVGGGQAVATQAAAATTETPSATADAQGRRSSSNEKTGGRRFSRGLDDIVKLVKTNVAESVVLAFIRNSPVAYRPGADEVIELRELGFSDPVLTAMLERGRELRQAAARIAATAPPPIVYYVPTAYPPSSPTVVYASYPTSTSYPPVVSYGYVPRYSYPSYYRYSYYPRSYYTYYPHRGFSFGFGHRGYYSGYQ